MTRRVNCSIVSVWFCNDVGLQVYTAGGGAASQVWSDIRQQMLGVPVVRSPSAEAAYGAALLASQPTLNG